MRRRTLLAGLGAAAIAWQPTARAQSDDRVRRVGWLSEAAQTDPEERALITAFLQQLAQLGWVDGRNVQLVYRFAAGDAERVKIYAAELVGQFLDLIVAPGARALSALRQFPPAQPILFLQISDPVGEGGVASLAHPGGNVTGLTNFDPDLGGKWVQLLNEAAPGLARVTVLSDADFSLGRLFVRAIEQSAPGFGLTVGSAPVADVSELGGIIATVGRRPNNGLIILPDRFTVTHQAPIAALATRYRLPAVYPYRSFVSSGGLMSYGLDVADAYRGAAIYADRILRGAKPADLPVQDPTRFELAINLKAAAAIGLALPQSLLNRAGQVIQ